MENEVYEVAQALVANRGEQAVIRDQEFAEQVIEQLNMWGCKYDCQFAKVGGNFSFYLSVK